MNARRVGNPAVLGDVAVVTTIPPEGDEYTIVATVAGLHDGWVTSVHPVGVLIPWGYPDRNQGARIEVASEFAFDLSALVRWLDDNPQARTVFDTVEAAKERLARVQRHPVVWRRAEVAQ